MEYSKQSAVGFIALALTGILALGLAVTEVLAGPLKPALANIRTWIMMGETSILFLWLWFCLCREDKKWLRTAVSSCFAEQADRLNRQAAVRTAAATRFINRLIYLPPLSKRFHAS